DRHRDEPFFVYYPMNLTHWPFEPTPDSPGWDPTARREHDAEQALEGDRDPQYFGDMVEYADKLVGNVIDKLEQAGLRENTLVMFTSDNGTERGVPSILNGEEFVGGKLTSTEAGTHVAMIANWPGVVPEGVVDDQLVCFTYVFPTLAEVAGIDPPENLQLDGQSLAPLLYGKETDLRDWLYMWWYRNNDPDGPGDEFARTDRYKYYQDGRFYDLREDPLEERAPIDEDELTDEQRDVRDELRQIISRYTREGFYDT
ncbi:MAG: sulfatase-like hydrolase/transferase, partial [Rhodothermales bacterium]